jgi:hypothetical protein
MRLHRHSPPASRPLACLAAALVLCVTPSRAHSQPRAHDVPAGAPFVPRPAVVATIRNVTLPPVGARRRPGAWDVQSADTLPSPPLLASPATERRRAFLAGAVFGAFVGAAVCARQMQAAAGDDGVMIDPVYATTYVVVGALLGGILFTSVHDAHHPR